MSEVRETMARRTKVADTQLAFDLWGEFTETEQNNDQIEQATVSAVAGSLAGDGQLFGAGWADQQRPASDAGNRLLRESHTGLVGGTRDQRGRLDGPARGDLPAETVMGGGDRSTDAHDSGGLSGAAAGTRDGSHGRDAVSGGLAGSEPELRHSGRPILRDGGDEGRRAALSITRAGIEAEELGRPSAAVEREEPRTGDAAASLPGDAFDRVSRPGTGRARLGGGLAAVVTLERLLQERREPTVDERAELSRFPGWGALPELFDPKNDKYASERAQLEEIWSVDEWRAARRTVLNAHYTNPEYVKAMWAAVGRLGLPTSADVLEPGCGSGNFIAAAPTGTSMTGVELDSTTAKIAGFLHRDAKILNESFADTRLEGDGYDAAIGNVPFGQAKLHDPAYNPAGLSLHNHFIVKSLRMTKPGGIVAVMSSRWTMDGKAERSRREIAKYGELLGAVRMPAGAHGETAGTDAIIDVLVFRRHSGEAPPVEPAWLHTVEVDGTAGPVASNQYFVDRPEMVLGSTDTRMGRFGPEIYVTAPSTRAEDVTPLLDRALQQITAAAIADGKTWAAAGQVVTDRPVARVLQDENKLVGRVYVAENGDLETVGLNGPEPLKVPKNAQVEVRQLLELRDAAVALLNAEAASSEDTPEITQMRADLNRIYDDFSARFGPLGRFTETVREREGKEPIITRRYPPALKALRTDPHYATVVALERFNEDTGVARKATIFEKRVVAPVAEVTSVDSPDDAIRISMDRFGAVDIPFVAELLDVTELEAIEQLGDRVFLSPADNDTFIPAEEFLSGNVRQKRAEIRELAAADERFQKHLDALEAVIPAEVGPAEINVRFGAGWVPKQYVSEFIEHALGKEVRALERIDGEWRFSIKGGRASTTAEAKWGVTGRFASAHAYQVFKDVIGNKKLELTYRVDDRQFVDQDATEALQERAMELHEAFQDWLWKDADRAEHLQTRYNDLYNGIVLRSYDNVRLSFPGTAASWTPHPHQHAAVARMLSEPAAGLFHEVGAGKTAEMVMGVMELKRLGLATKPAIIVPNQMLEQFTREFKQIYPQAKVLSAGTADIARTKGQDARKLFVRRAQTNDWDCVIMTHSAFEKIGLGEATTAYASEKLAEMTEIHEQKLASSLSKDSVKKLEDQIQRQEENLKAMLDLDYDEGVTWDETGIDYLCVDEAHLFKNLTVTSSVGDLAKAKGSNRAQDLDMKLWYHRDHLKQSRVATLATATPLPNSMIEMYVMMRYLRPDLLKTAEVYRADDWALQFTEQVTAVEPKPGGGGFQVNTRTARFRNLPELLNMWHVSGDVKTQADLNLKVPELPRNSKGEHAPEMVIVPATDAQQAGMNDIIERAELVKNRQVEPEEDNMLKITSDGRAIALDARLRDLDGPLPEETTKIDIVADKVATIWEETRDNEYLDEWGDVSDTPGALQIVFCDLGTPEEDPDKWDAYHHLRDQLVARGMPAEKIRFIHEATNDKTKAELFQQCRDGRVAVLIGSTEKMGVGTNVQTRAIALHHVDAPWRPADVTQREGRLIRQGNQNGEVQVFRYATEGSFDAYMWGTLARKASFIEQVLSGRLDVREADNSSEMALQFAEMQAITIGDMRILEMANLKQETQKLARQERSHLRKIDSVHSRRLLQQQIGSGLERDIDLLKQLQPKVTDTQGDAFAGAVSRSRWASDAPFSDRKEFGLALKHQLSVSLAEAKNNPGWGPHNQNYPKAAKTRVTVGGLDWDAHFRWNPVAKDDPVVEFHADGAQNALRFEMRFSRITGGDHGSLSRGFEQRAAGLTDQIAAHEASLTASNKTVVELEELEREVWPKKEELEFKKQRLAEIVAELEREAAGPQASTPDQSVQSAQVAPKGPTFAP